MNQEKIAVILFQLGGPDSLDGVEPFLVNLFSDPDIFDFPLASLIRKPLARVIASMRVREVGHRYITIGSKSPILELTKLQADTLETELRKEIDVRVFVAMRYSFPDIEFAVQSLSKAHFDKIILLPLYPHYSKTTTGSSINEWHRQLKKNKFSPLNEIIIKEFYDNPLYIESLVDQINLTIRKFVNIPHKEIQLIFSAHGIPESLVASGDPYKSQIEKTVELVLAKGNWDLPNSLCYQSKVGPMKWVGPSLIETVTNLSQVGTRYLLVVPISFVSEHIETLFEIDIDARRLATGFGVKQFEMMPALNANAKFILALKELVLNAAFA
jgi:ferrochelatase